MSEPNLPRADEGEESSVDARIRRLEERVLELTAERDKARSLVAQAEAKLLEFAGVMAELRGAVLELSDGLLELADADDPKAIALRELLEGIRS